MAPTATFAPGWPGIPPRWTSSAKSGVGTALNQVNRTWFTLSHGILDEVYYARVDQACIRDMGLIVTDGREFFSEEKRQTNHQVEQIALGCPAYRLINSCTEGRYRIEKEVIADPGRDVILHWIRFVPQQGRLDDYHLYVLLAPHLGNHGSGNSGRVGDYKGVPMLFAHRGDLDLALACSAPWLKRSVGFVGFSDGWQDLVRHKRMEWLYEQAENGNVALTGEVDLQAGNGVFVLALAFGLNSNEAGHRARASLLSGFNGAREEYVREWQNWQKTLLHFQEVVPEEHSLYHTSMMVLRAHEAKRFPGGIIASLSIPWGFAKGDNDLGGYHLLWPRDLVEAAGGLLAAGSTGEVRRVLRDLHVIQEADGHWPQNAWLDGTPYWTGLQMDETALPILLLDLTRREGLLDNQELVESWPMVLRAAGFLVRNGPVTQEDRWEEDPGYSPFTLAVEVAALLAAAELAEEAEKVEIASYLKETADAWNDSIERWTYVSGTELAQRFGVEGYYVRIAPPNVADGASIKDGYVPIKNRPPGQSELPAVQMVSPDALALVRFGLRAADDPRILNTIKVIDGTLKVETPYGPAWHRYNGDGYGEHADGSPFNGTGIGRAWPLLTGERAHYELAAGHREEAVRLLLAMEAFANRGGMIPEQIWDSPDIPSRGLYFGRPSGSAMPLVWAHAEYVKLRRSLQEGAVFDLPPQTVQRYQAHKTASPFAIWRFNNKTRAFSLGKTLRVEVLAPAIVRWSTDGWKTVQDTATHDTGLGVHLADLPTARLTPGTTVTMTFYWPQAGRWEGKNFTLQVRE